LSLVDINEIRRSLDSLAGNMTWAEAEITAAQRRHPAAAQRLWRSFSVLQPTHPLMRTGSVYRSHCRELLDRVAQGADTRPGTAAECCIALSETSMQVPLRTSAVALYFCMWRLAGLPPVELATHSEHYEALEGSLIDDHEAWLRSKLRQNWRVLAPAPAGSATQPQPR
jgi:hypothetical protein